MKNFLMLILALAAAWIVWHLIIGFVASIFHIALTIAVIALFIWLVSSIYTALTREKVKY